MEFADLPLIAAPGFAIVSFWPSARGHWAGVVLALPSLVLGILILFAIAREKGHVYPGTLPAALLYISLGALSIRLWMRKRHTSSVARPNEEL